MDDAYAAKKQKELEAQQLLDSIDDYLLGELGIELPEPEENTIKNRIFIRNLSEVSGDRFDCNYNHKINYILSQTGNYKIEYLKNLLIKPPQYGANEIAVDKNNSGEINYIRITDIDDLGFLKVRGLKTALKIEDKYILNQHDWLFARSGSVGRCYLHQDNKQKAIFAGYLIRFVLNTQIANPYYIFYYCHSKIYKMWVDAISRYAVQSNINSEEYKQLQEKYFPTNNGSAKYEEFSKRIKEKYFSPNEVKDKFDELSKLIHSEDYSTFKIKFDEFEVELKAKKDYKTLSDIYGLALYSFEKNEIFRKEDVEEKLNFIILHLSELTKEEQIDFECTLIEFYVASNQKYNEGLKLCNKNLNVGDINQKLYFYRFKILFERYLGNSQAINTSYKTLQIAVDAYGENDPRLLTYYLDILALDITGNDLNTTKIASKALKIIYDNFPKIQRKKGLWNGTGARRL
jgi:hypothetical protein